MGSVQSLVGQQLLWKWMDHENGWTFPSEFDDDQDDLPSKILPERPRSSVSWKDETLTLQFPGEDSWQSVIQHCFLSSMTNLPRRLVIRGALFNSLSDTDTWNSLWSLVSPSLQELELECTTTTAPASHSFDQSTSDVFWKTLSCHSFPQLTSISLVGDILSCQESASQSVPSGETAAVEALAHLIRQNQVQVLHMDSVTMDHSFLSRVFASTTKETNTTTTTTTTTTNPLALHTLSIHNCDMNVSTILSALSSAHLALHSFRLSQDATEKRTFTIDTNPSLDELGAFLQSQSSTLRHVHLDGLFSSSTTTNIDSATTESPSSLVPTQQTHHHSTEWKALMRILQQMPYLTSLSLNDWSILSSNDQEMLVQTVAQGHFSNTFRSLSLLFVSNNSNNNNNNVDDLSEGLSYDGDWIDYLSQLPLQELRLSLGHSGCPRDDMHVLDAIAQQLHHNTQLTTFTDEAYFPYMHHPSIRQTIQRNRWIRQIQNILMGRTTTTTATTNITKSSGKRIPEKKTFKEEEKVLPIHLWPHFWPRRETHLMITDPKTMTIEDDTRYEVSAVYQGLLARAPDLGQLHTNRKKRSLV